EGMEYFTGSENETRETAKAVVGEIVSKHSFGPVFVGLVGDLGAGKTTFMKGVAEFFGISETISSPTFVIQKIYEILEENRETKNYSLKRLIHMDMYRLENEEDLKAIDWEFYKSSPDNILFVEWPNQIWENALEGMIEIKIEHLEDDKRRIIYG